MATGCQVIFIACIIIGLFILLVVYLATCVNVKVAQNQYLVISNRYTMTINPVLEQGNYNNLKIGNRKAYYIATIQYLNYDNKNSIICYSSDGLQLYLEIGIQYLYDKEFIIPVMWRKFSNEKNYMSYYRSVIYNTIYTICANYGSEEYYTNRQIIETSMFNMVINQTSNINIGIKTVQVQLKNIDFPSTFSEIIAKKQLLVQELQTQNNNRTSQLILANTSYVQAIQKARQLLIEADNNVDIISNQAYATQNNVFIEYQQKTIVYKQIMSNFNFNASELADYLEADILRLSNNPTIVSKKTII